MSIASQITDYSNGLSNAYNMVSQRGGTMPQRKNMQNLATAIATIPSGSCPEPEDDTIYEPVITNYSNGVITGEHLGDINGKVFYLKREHHESVPVVIGSWNDTTITLSDDPDIQQGETSLWVVRNDGVVSNKIIIGDISDSPADYLAIYYTNLSTGSIEHIYINTETDYVAWIARIDNSTSQGGPIYNSGGVTVYRNSVVGLQFGPSAATYHSTHPTLSRLRFARYFTSLDQPISIPEGVTATPESFMEFCFNFNQPIKFPSTLTKINSWFLTDSYSFNQPVIIPEGVTSIGTYFLGRCWAFNNTLTFPSTMGSIGDYFMISCTAFNKPLIFPDNASPVNGSNGILYGARSFNSKIVLPKNSSTWYSNVPHDSWNSTVRAKQYNGEIVLPGRITSIPNSFLFNYSQFNQPIVIPSTVTSIGTQFMYGCYAFNSEITITSSVSVGDSFMRDCCSFDQPFDFSKISGIGSDFFRGATSFNQPIALTNSALTSIGDRAFYDCDSFNSEINFGNSLQTIGDSFMYQLESFNQPLDLNNVTSIGSNFLQNAANFNQDIIFRKIVTIGQGFLYQVRCFNSNVILPNTLTTIGQGFLRDCYSFTKPISIPASVTSIGERFMQGIVSFRDLNVETTASPVDSDSLYPPYANMTSSYGVYVTGAGASTWVANLPRINGRRNLIAV